MFQHENIFHSLFCIILANSELSPSNLDRSMGKSKRIIPNFIAKRQTESLVKPPLVNCTVIRNIVTYSWTSLVTFSNGW